MAEELKEQVEEEANVGAVLATLKLIVAARSDSATTIKIDDVEYTIEAGAGIGYILTVNVSSGAHTIKRGNNESALYAISLGFIIISAFC